MSKFLNVIIVLGLLIVGGYLGYLGFQYMENRALEKERIEKRKQELEILRKQEDINARAREIAERQHQEVIARQRAERERLATGKPTPEPERQVGLATGVSEKISPSRYTGVVKACKEAGCHLMKYKDRADGTFITVQGPDQTTVTEVLNILLRGGMRDFKEHPELGRVGIDRDGRNVFTAAYTLKW
jgi:hypothetical protein